MARIEIEIGQTVITSNGGGNALPIEELFDRLASETLDPTFGEFVEIDPESCKGGPLHPAGTVDFFGNFYTFSHVFSIATRDADLAKRLTDAINANMLTPAYAAAKAEIAEHKRLELLRQAEKDRKRLEDRGRMARHYQDAN